MAVSFIKYALIISPANADLNKIELITLIGFEFKLQFILFDSLLAIFFYLHKNEAHKTDLSRCKDTTYVIFRTLFQLI